MITIKRKSKFEHTLEDRNNNTLSIRGETDAIHFTIQVTQIGDGREPTEAAAIQIPVKDFWDLISKLPGAPT